MCAWGIRGKLTEMASSEVTSEALSFGLWVGTENVELSAAMGGIGSGDEMMGR